MLLPALLLALATQDAAHDPPAAHRDVSAAEALAEGVAWLLANQNDDGSWGSHHSARPIEVLASVPGSLEAFRVATTGLVLCALMEADAEGPALERGFTHLVEHGAVRRQSGMEHYNVWSFGYALRALGERLLGRPDDPRAAEYRATAATLVEKLTRYQSLDGGWGYLSLWGYETYRPAATSMSFTTATILVGLDRVRRAGVEVPAPLLERALDALERTRLGTGSFTYGPLWNDAPASVINRRAGAACRTPACQLALRLHDRAVPVAEEAAALTALLVKEARFQRLGLRRPIPHESWYAISGYFYLYGHAYAAITLDEAQPSVQARLAPKLVEAVLVCRQPDGSFWDYPLYSFHKPYGTAYAVIALARAQRSLSGGRGD